MIVHRVCVLVALLALACNGNSGAAAADVGNLSSSAKEKTKGPAPLPTFAAIEKQVHEQLKSRKGYESGDMLSRTDGQGVLSAVSKLGWKVADASELLKRVAPDDDFLLRQLRSPEGIRLMRHTAKDKNGYDRLDRYSQLPQGHQMTRDLVTGVDGFAMVDYMSSETGTRELSAFLRKVPDGANFSKATGRIYTESQLIAALKTSYHEAEVERAKTAGGSKTARP